MQHEKKDSSGNEAGLKLSFFSAGLVVAQEEKHHTIDQEDKGSEPTENQAFTHGR